MASTSTAKEIVVVRSEVVVSSLGFSAPCKTLSKYAAVGYSMKVEWEKDNSKLPLTKNIYVDFLQNLPKT